MCTTGQGGILHHLRALHPYPYPQHTWVLPRGLISYCEFGFYQNVQLARAPLLDSPSYSLPSGKSCWTWTSGKRSASFNSAFFMIITAIPNCSANCFFRRLFRSSSLSAVAVVATSAWPLTTGGGVEICFATKHL